MTDEKRLKVTAEPKHKCDWVGFASINTSPEQYQRIVQMCNDSVIRWTANLDPKHFMQMVFVHPDDQDLAYIMLGDFMKRFGFIAEPAIPGLTDCLADLRIIGI
jgi:hypothetical protein